MNRTFERLQSICASKAIVCERRGRKVELTTPCGGTTAECDGVNDAYATLANDPTFHDLPIVLRKHPEVNIDTRRENLRNEIAESNRRIESALRELRRSVRGQSVLTSWKLLCECGAIGLDQQGWFALQTLVNETANGRRDYIDTL